METLTRNQKYAQEGVIKIGHPKAFITVGMKVNGVIVLEVKDAFHTHVDTKCHKSSQDTNYHRYQPPLSIQG